MGWLSRLLRPPPPLIAASEFDAAVARLPILMGLNTEELARLRRMASLFIHTKFFTAAGGAEISRSTQLAIALQACLLILNLDEHSYQGWREIVLYPNAFLRPQQEIDAAGVVHSSRDILSGESWHSGPLVLSIDDALAGGQDSGHNVVLHEFAHKLDMLNGIADGFPPLHRGMDSVSWERDFSAAYADFQSRVDRGEITAINPYAATQPAEFFAVLSEVFFETPAILQLEYPKVYTQLREFYRQDPLSRGSVKHDTLLVGLGLNRDDSDHVF